MDVNSNLNSLNIVYLPTFFSILMLRDNGVFARGRIFFLVIDISNKIASVVFLSGLDVKVLPIVPLSLSL